MRNVPTRQLITIVMTIAMLVAVLVMQRRCASAVGNLFAVIGPVSADGGSTSDLTSHDTARK